jgi:hypothetical protein
MPPLALEPPGHAEQAFEFCIVYFVLCSVALLLLPKRWMRRLIQVAFHLRSDSRIDGEVQ